MASITCPSCGTYIEDEYCDLDDLIEECNLCDDIRSGGLALAMFPHSLSLQQMGGIGLVTKNSMEEFHGSQRIDYIDDTDSDCL